MSEREQCKQGPEAIIARKLKSMKITWVHDLGRWQFFFFFFLYTLLPPLTHLLAGSRPTLAEEITVFSSIHPAG